MRNEGIEGKGSKGSFEGQKLVYCVGKHGAIKDMPAVWVMLEKQSAAV